MGEAFDAVCTALLDSGQPQMVYNDAKRIIDAAKAASQMSMVSGMLD